MEAQTADRPIPLISFVARQRDLRELVGDHVTGAQQLAFGDVLKWWDARFHTITLEDRNLPAIAERRVLKPKSVAARQELDEAFRETATVREEVMNTLLTSTANREMFRQVYPFSPALVQSLVAVSSVLQRERTALKVMLQLLVDQRDTLKVGDVVPVGDLFDAIAQGDEAFSEGMRIHFDNAKQLYHRKLLPMLERTHNLTREELRALPQDDARAIAFRADDRLIKTLLLAALVPEVEALKALTPARLAALNHGSIRTPIAGREGQEVLRRLRGWAAQVGEIKLSDDANPTVSLQLTGVDTESIIEQARNIDNAGNRQRKVREILFHELGVTDSDELFPVHEFEWRGTARTCEILYTNVRELSDDSLKPRDEDTWRVAIDYPFDVDGKTPNDDLARLQDFSATGAQCRTLVWLPAFLSRDSLKDLGTLVILDHILTGERFAGVSAHLSPVDRAQARSLLENQQSQLRQKLKTHARRRVRYRSRCSRFDRSVSRAVGAFSVARWLAAAAAGRCDAWRSIRSLRRTGARAAVPGPSPFRGAGQSVRASKSLGGREDGRRDPRGPSCRGQASAIVGAWDCLSAQPRGDGRDALRASRYVETALPATARSRRWPANGRPS